LAPLLEYVTDLEVRDGLGWTPLMSAINRGSKQNVKLLLKRGAKVDCDWVHGLSLIADAMNFYDLELVTLLIDNGAQVAPPPDMLTSEQDLTGYYLLHYAVDEGNIDMARLLIEKGKAPLNLPDQSGWTPLHLAAGHGYAEIVDMLLKQGADVNVKDKSGNTPLAWARKMETDEAVTSLIRAGGMADKEWHGEPLQLKSYEEHQEAAGLGQQEEGENGSDANQGVNNGLPKSQFEIEVKKINNKRQGSLPTNEKQPVLDALQRQQSKEKTIL